MVMQHAMELRGLARRLREGGLSYSAIVRELETPIPVATLKKWCEGLEAEKKAAGGAGHKGAVKVSNEPQLQLVAGATAKKVRMQAGRRANELVGKGLNKDMSELILAGLFIVSGNSINDQSGIEFCSSNERTINLFISLLRNCYNIDERKFRVSVVCGPCVEPELLLKGWSQVTGVPLAQFYEPEIAEGKSNLRLESKQVASFCTISYLSEFVLVDISAVADNIIEIMGGVFVDINAMVKENITANKR